jgi:hypothetical protein
VREREDEGEGQSVAEGGVVCRSCVREVEGGALCG